ncbi:MAG: iron complex transport system substrate-binding protein [bacterium]|nr:MAG: iron complex transport system substrate-binding protein [bacterium]
MRSKSLVILFLFFVLTLNLFACQQEKASLPNPESTDYQTVTDEIGRQVKIVNNPKRIISLAPSITEILFALDLGQQVVGVTSYCNYPTQAAKITQVSDTLHPNLEMVISLKPDLVLISTASQLEQFMAKLSEVGIPVFVIKSQSVEGVLNSIELVGQITSHKTQARDLTVSLKKRLEAVKAQVQGQTPPKVFFIVGTEPLITAGKPAFVTDLINLAGGKSISDDVSTEWPAYSIESVIARGPEIILSPGAHNFDDTKSVKATLPKGLEVTPAVRNEQTYQIDGDLILRPGPRIIDGLEQMTKLFHAKEK